MRDTEQWIPSYLSGLCYVSDREMIQKLILKRKSSAIGEMDFSQAVICISDNKKAHSQFQLHGIRFFSASLYLYLEKPWLPRIRKGNKAPKDAIPKSASSRK